MVKKIKLLLKSALKDMQVSDVDPVVEISERAEHGEYTTNVAMTLSKRLKKSPMEIAQDIVKRIKNNKIDHNNIKVDQKTSRESGVKSVLKDIKDIKIVKPGFINFFISEEAISRTINTVLESEKDYGKAPKLQKNIIIEYTDPNPFKEFHVGHLYSNAVGESLARLYESRGFDVKRANYFGDVGMHVAKSIWGLKKKLISDNTSIDKLEKKKIKERIKFLGESYALGASAYKEDKGAQEEIKDINYLVYVSAQDFMIREFKWKPQVDYKSSIKGIENQLEEISMLFNAGRKWSLDYFETIFKRLGTKFDYYYPESTAGEYGAKFVKENIGKVFQESDGAIIYKGEEAGLHTRVFINSLGLPTYEAKELGLAFQKHQDYPYDLSLIVTGNEINEYFKVLMSALGKIRQDLKEKTKHIGHGMVRLPTGKMSSRTGKVLTGDWLIEEVKKHLLKIIEAGSTDYKGQEKDDIAEKVAISAIKYSMLRVKLPADISFDYKKSLSFEGDSGPYLQYTYARCKSVLRRAQDKFLRKAKQDVSQVSIVSNVSKKSSDASDASDTNLNPEEKAVARLLMYFPEVAEKATNDFSPSVLCSYLHELAQVYNLFYQKHKIIVTDNDVSSIKPACRTGRYQVSSKKKNSKPNLTPDTLTPDTMKFRLALTSATAYVLKNGLYLLGIQTVERM